MSALELGRWEPLSLDAAVATFADAPFRWWVSGGRALELHLQQCWREHGDIDVGVVRNDLSAVRAHLHDWDVHVAAAGSLAPWDGGPLGLDLHQNNLWSRRTDTGPWELDVTIGEGTADSWIYRRDVSIRVPWERAVLSNASGVPYLAPELQLLYKSKGLRPKDDVDAGIVIPSLGADQRTFLATHLGDAHPWRHLLA